MTAPYSGPLLSLPNSSRVLTPTVTGCYLHTDADVLAVLQACLQGLAQHIPRRPHDRERPELIKSGSVFVYEENASGIKRWTDGVSWSPSRILKNFLVYRELEAPFPPGEKKRATKRKRSITEDDGDDSKPAKKAHLANEAALKASQNRGIHGSLVDSYPFKEEGLVKKTFSIRHKGVHHHIVNYCTVDDVRSGRILRPFHFQQFVGMGITPELKETCKGLKVPINEFQDAYGPENISIEQIPIWHAHGLPPDHKNAMGLDVTAAEIEGEW
ncbi:hypothetical protein K402DRAFT_333358 [Aulographum hederae CBS 113979]|uniref:Camp independent regulatory protein n=1 Tax=Aulographum hederae CBS 113979 TaxID=1176131 RepID=A0A6G1GYQ2_9PEZI|nr:hypothetical protein K402DRAFT_333358 [Aulographum hederae CBS 113979]